MSGGTLSLNSANAIGNTSASSTALRITGGNIDNTSGAAITLTTNPVMEWNGDFAFLGSNGANSNLNLGTGAMTMNASRQVTVTNAATTLTVGGIISGNTSKLTKAGSGTLALSGANTYTGGTDVNIGTLLVNNTTGSGTGTAAVAVKAGTVADTPVARLGGTGSVGGNLTLNAQSATGLKNGGILAPTAATSGTALDVTGTTTFGAGSIFEWNFSATTPGTDPGAVTNHSSYGQLNGAAAITGSNAIFKIVLGGTQSFTDAFWNSDKSWTNVFDGSGATTNLSSIFSSISGNGITFADNKGTVSGQGYFTLNGAKTLDWTAIPEPGTALGGLLLTAGLLRRRRKVEG